MIGTVIDSITVRCEAKRSYALFYAVVVRRKGDG